MSDKWYFTIGDREYGPVSFREMEYYLRQVPNWYDQYVWRAGFENWVLASSIPDLSPSGPQTAQAFGEDDADTGRSPMMGWLLLAAPAVLVGVAGAILFRWLF